MGNCSKNLSKAKQKKNDEFYTQYKDIENEVKKHSFKNMCVLCNCNDGLKSNFFKFFRQNFNSLGLKKLICISYNPNGHGIAYIMLPNLPITINELNDNGGFATDESIEFLKECDVVVTNPPFSKFLSFMKILFNYDKKFLIIGNQNAITNRNIFEKIKANKLWINNSFKGTVGFFINEHYNDYAKSSQHKKGHIRVSGVVWYTNYGNRDVKQLELKREYLSDFYCKYDDYDAINIPKVKDIPCDYYGKMGVPITFIYKYDPSQFTILGLDAYMEDNPRYGKRFRINGKETYARIIILLKPKNKPQQ